ncbi:MAG: tetratricopeptide repeat protein [Bacteroidetes bacterium]|nr:tetratricopeptide repeat protein [Bacteroidota bacterium]
MIPTGNVTFLFTDIEGSTKLAHDFPESLQCALTIHNSVLRNAVVSNNGFVFKTAGDAFFCSFKKAEDAVRTSLMIQKDLSLVYNEDVTLKVRIGIHSGIAEWNGEDYMGYITLARSQRIMSSAHGGQVIISADAYESIDTESITGITCRDLGVRRLKDMVQPVRLFQINSEGLQSEFPPLKTLDARPNNLPVQLTSFIGREKEINNVKSILSKSRLLTLLGSGGTGKTRLSLQTGADMIDEFENGVWITELASLQDPFLLPNAIAETLGLKEQPGMSMENILTEYLKDKQILLILDNCEHLIESCAVLAEKLLQYSPKLKMIATSREALRCDGEIIHKVLSLDHPDPAKKISPKELAKYEAVRLFIERALAVNPNFRVNDDNAQALSQICFQLDGIPLAIELAAVRIRILTLEKICEKLNDRFRLLTGGKRTALPRQQTLKALIDWSYDLLSEQEKVLWRRLSVFSGGWSLNDAEEICSDDLTVRDDMFELTNGLVEKSIILFNDNTERYKMLETIKQYGEEKLRNEGETEIFRTRHLNYYLNLCEGAIPELSGPNAKTWLNRFEDEYPNIQSALNWSYESKANEKGHRLANTMAKLWDIRGYFTEALNWLEKLLKNTEGVSELLIANSKRQAGMFATQQGNNDIALRLLEESLNIYRKTDDLIGISNCLNILGMIELDLGNFESSKNYLTESLQIRKKLDNKLSLASGFNSLGLVLLAEGNLKDAEQYFTDSLKIAKEIKDDVYIGIGLNNLGQIYAIYGEYEKAKAFFEEGLMIDRELENKNGMCISLANMGILAYVNKDFSTSRKYLQEGLELSREIGNRLGELYALCTFGQLALAEEDIATAYNFFKECLLQQKEYSDIKISTICFTGIAEIKLINGDYDTASLLIGAVQAKLDLTGAFVEDETKIKINEIINSIKNIAGEERYLSEFEKGKRLPAEKVNEIAFE